MGRLHLWPSFETLPKRPLLRMRKTKKIPAASGREVGIKILLVGNQKR
jgi:hypothetical protein